MSPISKGRTMRALALLVAMAALAVPVVPPGEVRAEPSGPVASGAAAAAAPRARFRAVHGFPGHAGLYAYGMDYDTTDDTVLVGDVWNHRILRFTRDGRLLGVVSRTAPPGQLGGITEPFDVEADPDGHVWTAAQGPSRVVEFDHDGRWLRTIGHGGSPGSSYPRGCGGGSMTWPTHVAVHPPTGNVYVSDTFCKAIYVFTHSGRFLFPIDVELRDHGVVHPIPRGMDWGPDGNLYVVEHHSRRILSYSPSGTRLTVSPSRTDMNDPRGLAIDSRRRRIHVVAAFRNEVFTFGLDGRYIGKHASAGGRRFRSIRFPAVDDDGNVYVGDTWGYRVWRLSPAGSRLRWRTGRQPPPRGGNNQLNGIGIDGRGRRLYTVDTFEQRVQRYGIVDPSTGRLQSCRSRRRCESWQRQWGRRGQATPRGDGLNYPRGLTVGGRNVFVDGGNSVLRYRPSGRFLGRWGERGSRPGQFLNGPRGLDAARTRRGRWRLYTTDLGSCRLQVFTFGGRLRKHMGGGCGSGRQQMRGPWQPAVDRSRTYVADAGADAVVVWNVRRKRIVRRISPVVAGLGLSGPRGVAISPDRRWVYIADTGNRRIVRTRRDGSSPQLVTTGRDVPEGRLGGPEYLEMDRAGRLYVSDNNQRVYVFTTR